MTYDEAIRQLEHIVASLETDEALSMEEYKQKAQEANRLITVCRQQLTNLTDELNQLLPKDTKA